MDSRLLAYRPESDFTRVRDFLVHTYGAFDAPVNWGIERWNYARYFVAPMLGSYGSRGDAPDGCLQAIRLWEDLVGIWEADGEIIGVATIEHPAVWHPGYGEIFGRAFNHEDPREWPSAFAYKELMRAPDYSRDRDLIVAAPDGTYAACCIIWYDEVNQAGHLEPLGTHPAYRQRGLGRELLLEGLHRLRDLGAVRLPMTGGFDPFYESFGFRKLWTCYAWEKTITQV
jgi:ribosomal protein S18 acetylase RimI-like enzyme